MKFKQKLIPVLLFGLLTLSAYTFANSHSIHRNTPKRQIASISPIQSYEQDFNFDWNSYKTIAINKAKIKKTEAFLKTIDDYSTLSESDRHSLGILLYKLGTFYAYITHETDLAIERMSMADPLLVDTEAKAWNYNHLAYAYEQKFAATKKLPDREKSLKYTNKVISGLYHHIKNSEVAFAYCVKALVLNDAKDYSYAETSLQVALKIYEKLPGGKDDQYARAKNHLAMIILNQNNRDEKALAMLQELKQYWLSKKDISHDPYAAKNFIALGKAYLKMDNEQAALHEFEMAIRIYKNVYGKNNEALIHPYQLLAEGYKKMDTKKTSMPIKKTNHH